MRSLSALFLLATSACVCAQSPSTHLTLSIDDPTGAHVRAASIDIDRASPKLHIVAQSDPDGNFSIDLPPGSYALTVTEPGFTVYRQPLEIVATPVQQNKVTLHIAPNSGPTQVTMIGAPGSPPIEIKVVVINMFEAGADTGDTPGEYQHWVENEHLDTILPFPQGYHDLRINPKTGVLGLLAGVGTAKASASVMALGLDPRFDLTHAYFLVAGIGGIDPDAGSLASAVWSEWIVDGDLGYEIDAREIPHATAADRALWTTGYIPLRKTVPYEQPPQPMGEDGNATFHLNPALVDWAYRLTKDVVIPDSPELKTTRMRYDGAAAHRPPFVLKGDNVSSSTFWHGQLMQQWARDWVKYFTGGKGTYAICGMEDSGTLQSLTFLATAHKVDLSRILVLRTASNYDVPRNGLTATESIADTKIGHYSAYLPSLDTAYRVGHVVVDSIVDHWAKNRTNIPVNR